MMEDFDRDDSRWEYQSVIVPIVSLTIFTDKMFTNVLIIDTIYVTLKS